MNTPSLDTIHKSAAHLVVTLLQGGVTKRGEPFAMSGELVAAIRRINKHLAPEVADSVAILATELDQAGFLETYREQDGSIASLCPEPKNKKQEIA